MTRKKGMYAVTVLALLTLSALVPVVDGGFSYQGGMDMFVTYPKGDYYLGSNVDIEVEVFLEGNYVEPDNVTVTVGQYSSTRELNLTRVDTGRYTTNFTIEEGDMSTFGWVALNGEARIEDPPSSCLFGNVILVTPMPQFEMDVILVDPTSVHAIPGQTVALAVRTTLGGVPTDPEEHSLFLHARTENEQMFTIPLTKQGTGVYNGTLEIPPDLSESEHYYVWGEASYPVGLAVLTARDTVDIYVDFLEVWTHLIVNTKTFATIDMYVMEDDHTPVDGASIALKWSYRNDTAVLVENSTTGATDSRGIYAFTATYADIGEAMVTIEGNVTHSGRVQNVKTYVTAPVDLNVPLGFRVEIENKMPVDLDATLTVNHTAYMNGTPLASQDIHYYVANDYEVFTFGTSTTDASGRFSFDVHIPEANVSEYISSVRIYYHAKVDGEWKSYPEALIFLDWSALSSKQEYMDPKTTLRIKSFTTGGEVTVIFDHDDADGIDEAATISWAPHTTGGFFHGELPEWALMDIKHGYWVDDVAVTWTGEEYQATWKLPPFIPVTTPISILGTLVFDQDVGNPSMALIDGYVSSGENDPPTVTVTKPTFSEEIGGIYMANGTASDDQAVTRVQVQIDDGEWRNATGREDWRFKINGSALAEGPHTLRARSLDAETTSEVVAVTFFVNNSIVPENMPPTVTITFPLENSTITGAGVRCNYTGNAHDDGGVEYVQYNTGGNWHDVHGTTEWYQRLSFSGPNNDTRTFSVRAFDGELYSEVVNVTHHFIRYPTNEEPPSVWISQPYITQTFLPNETITVLATASDLEWEIVFVEFRFNGGEWIRDPSQDDGWSHTVDAGLFGLGTHVVDARSFDGEFFSEIDSRDITINKKEEPPKPSGWCNNILLPIGILAVLTIVQVRPTRRVGRS